MLTALDFWFGPGQEIIIAGSPEQKDTKEMLKLIHATFLPNSVVLFHPTGLSLGGAAGSSIEQIAPYIRQQTATNGKATVYICSNYVCRQPITTVSDLKSELAALTNQPD